MTSPSSLVGFPVVLDLYVAWGEMDPFQHVNNVVYFRYFENARIEYLVKCGWMDLMQQHGIGPIVHSTQARFRKPLRHPDRIQVGARITEISTDRVNFEHRIFSQTWGDLAAEGTALVVCYDYRKQTKCELPDQLRQNIERLEREVAKTPTPVGEHGRGGG